jgi:outer membrane protein OmpA-like peptidoglycan-associated protein
MGLSALIHVVPLALALALPATLVSGWVGEASESLAASQPQSARVVTASVAEEGYCTAELKQIVRRVAGACGLLGAEGRGCRPADASKVVSLSGDDFNQLFLPLRERVRIVQYDLAKAELDEGGRQAVEAAWAERGGASFFFVVARASPEGSVEMNRELSEARAKAVLAHLTQRFNDPDIERQVGLLWLGEEFAQLAGSFCDWNRSRAGESCDEKDINRSAFIAWIDCAI